ncbi:glycosyltransferase family 4 protein [Rhizobium sp. CFBP 8762]|uniref:glycosyltransferase family 4 protein n=1 Tax=Rhizobium sp. CFBP 8762 TaxID=2775279 RepID=UPI0017848A67|nr:glycosyltransferase family 4 protein [Rhizobium sp. CFBP 8762]MBD8554950.1 glycosyltransferase family 4 protein [Rhizobium sp. CFBP 8762]
MADMKTVTVIAPHFKRRLSGVTSTVIQLIPKQRALGLGIVTLGPGLPGHIASMRWRDLLSLWSAPSGYKHRIWHARRNNEMLTGIIFKSVFRMKLKLLFTSAAQRHHKPFTRWMIRHMDAVVATSAGSAAFLQVPHTIIRHGVDLDLFHPPRTQDDTIAATGLPGRYLIGCFGRVRLQKGTDLFVRAMIELLPRYPEWTAVISGRVTAEHSEFADSLKQAIAKAGLSDRIQFLGEVSDIKIWYRRLTLYVAPSRNEGFGLTPLEAMASQTAVIASTAGAYAEMIVRDVTGQVVEAGNFDQLRDAIAPLLAAPDAAEQMGRSALSHVQQNFALEREAKALQKTYDMLLAHS